MRMRRWCVVIGGIVTLILTSALLQRPLPIQASDPCALLPPVLASESQLATLGVQNTDLVGMVRIDKVRFNSSVVPTPCAQVVAGWISESIELSSGRTGAAPPQQPTAAIIASNLLAYGTPSEAHAAFDVLVQATASPADPTQPPFQMVQVPGVGEEWAAWTAQMPLQLDIEGQADFDAQFLLFRRGVVLAAILVVGAPAPAGVAIDQETLLRLGRLVDQRITVALGRS